MIAAIIGSGAVTDYAQLADEVKKCDYIICADGGIKHLINADIPPDVLIGDFDSCVFDEIKLNPILEGTEIHHHNPIKDDTDMQLCIDFALEKGYDDIRLFASLGGRIDHELSNIYNLKYIHQNRASGSIISDNDRIYITDSHIKVNRLDGYKLSLISLTDTSEGITLKGLYYPLADASLLQGSSLGISNEFVDDYAEIEVKNGLLLVILSKDSLSKGE